MQHSVSLSRSKIPLAASCTRCSNSVRASELVKVCELFALLEVVEEEELSDSSVEVLRDPLLAEDCWAALN